MLFEGKGGTRDLSEAIRLWSWAAQQGEPVAQFNLAEVYMKGAGVSKDLKKSLSLFTQAAKRFDVSKQLKEVSSQMEQEETAELH
jgi:TPR repeat protein